MVKALSSMVTSEKIKYEGVEITIIVNYIIDSTQLVSSSGIRTAD